MKRLLILALAACVAIIGYCRDNQLLDFAENSYDFGTIRSTDAPVVHEYEFTNIDTEPVAVLSVSTGCGCTRPEYPAKPLAPGEKAAIKITFLPAGQSGTINKSIQVRYRGARASSSKRLTLRLRGTVIPADSSK